MSACRNINSKVNNQHKEQRQAAFLVLYKNVKYLNIKMAACRVDLFVLCWKNTVLDGPRHRDGEGSELTHIFESWKAFLSIRRSWAAIWTRHIIIKWAYVGPPKENHFSSAIP